MVMTFVPPNVHNRIRNFTLDATKRTCVYMLNLVDSESKVKIVKVPVNASVEEKEKSNDEF